MSNQQQTQAIAPPPPSVWEDAKVFPQQHTGSGISSGISSGITTRSSTLLTASNVTSATASAAPSTNTSGISVSAPASTFSMDGDSGVSSSTNIIHAPFTKSSDVVGAAEHQHQQQQQQQQHKAEALVVITPSCKELPIGYIVGAVLRDVAVHHVTLNRFHSSLPASHVIKSLTVFESSVAPALDIADYFHRLQHYLQAEDGVCIAVLLLLRRYAKNSRRPITVYNVHRLAVVAMLVASKLYSDFFFCCEAVALVGGIPTKELARMEIHFLLAINWDGGVAHRYEAGNELVRAKAAHMLADTAHNLKAAMPPDAVMFTRLFPESLVRSDILRAETDGAPVAGVATAAQAAAAMAAVAANNPASDMTVESVAAAAAGRAQQVEEEPGI